MAKRRPKHVFTITEFANMMGKNTPQVRNLEAVYGLKTTGETIDLREFLPSLADFLGQVHQLWKHRHSKRDTESRKRVDEIEMKLKEIKLKRELDQVISVDGAKDIFDAIAEQIRGATRQLEKKHGADAAAYISEALDRSEELMRRWGQSPSKS